MRKGIGRTYGRPSSTPTALWPSPSVPEQASDDGGGPAARPRPAFPLTPKAWRWSVSCRTTAGWLLHHPFGLNCVVQQIEHRTTEVGSPETNRLVERFYRTLKDEFFSVTNRPKHYDSVEALQAGPATFVAFCNSGRAFHGYRT